MTQSLEPINVTNYLRFVEKKWIRIKDTLSMHNTKLFDEVMLIKVFWYRSKFYHMTNIVFKSRYPTENFPSVEFAINHWMDEVLWDFFSKINYLKKVTQVYDERCKSYYRRLIQWKFGVIFWIQCKLFCNQKSSTIK